jgi:hypothetical protein
MSDDTSWVGLVEVAFVFALALGFGIHQWLDLRRERRKRENRRDPG